MPLRTWFGAARGPSGLRESEGDPASKADGTRRGRVLEFLTSFQLLQGWIETLRALIRTFIAYIVNLFFPTNSSGNNLSRG